MSELNILAKLLLYSDICFVIVFALGFWLEHSNALLLAMFLIAILITYYPLYKYCTKCNKESNITDTKWHHDSEYIAIAYAVSRLFFLFSYILVSVIQKANIDISHTLVHLSFFTQTTIIIMCVLLIIIIFLAWRLNGKHNRTSRLHSFQSAITNFISHNISNKDKVILMPYNTAEELTKELYNSNSNINNVNNIKFKNNNNSLIIA